MRALALLVAASLLASGCAPGCAPGPPLEAEAWARPPGQPYFPHRFFPRPADMASGGGAPTIRGTYSGPVAAAPSYLTTRTFTLSGATTAGDFGIVCWFPASGTPAASDSGSNSWTPCQPSGGTNLACASAHMANSISSITLVGYQWQDWSAAFIALTGPTAVEAGTAGCNPAQNYYTNSLTTLAVTPAHANGAIVVAVQSGWTGDPGTTTLTSAAPWTESLAAFATTNTFRFATHLSPSNGSSYQSTWTHQNSASWESIPFAIY